MRRRFRFPEVSMTNHGHGQDEKPLYHELGFHSSVALVLVELCHCTFLENKRSEAKAYNNTVIFMEISNSYGNKQQFKLCKNYSVMLSGFFFSFYIYCRCVVGVKCFGNISITNKHLGYRKQIQCQSIVS